MLYLLKKNLKKISKIINCSKVRDHCHYTYKNRNKSHSTCNLKYNVPNEVSIVFPKDKKVTKVDKSENMIIKVLPLYPTK